MKKDQSIYPFKQRQFKHLPSGLFERLGGAVTLDLGLVAAEDGSPQDELAAEDAEGCAPRERGWVPVGPFYASSH